MRQLLPQLAMLQFKQKMLQPATRYSCNAFSLPEIVRLQGLPSIGNDWGSASATTREICDDGDKR
jgi:hypothetical protein